VIVRGPSALQIGDILQLLEETLTKIAAASLANHVTVVEPGRVRQRPYHSLP
jgi:hypothetical protein